MRVRIAQPVMGKARRRCDRRKNSAGCFPTQISYNIYMPKSGAQWIDIKNPTNKDLDWLKAKFHLHPVILQELKEPSARASVEVFKNYIYFVYYFPVYDDKEETSRRAEIDFVVGHDAVVTVQYEELEALDNLSERVADDSLMIVYQLVETILKFQERQLRHIREKTEEVGGELFKGKEKEVLRKVSRLKRDVSEYRIIVKQQGHILRSLLTKGPIFWGSEERPYLTDLVGDHLKIINQLDDYREAVADFEDSNSQLMNLKINEVMKTFTTLSFLTFPFVLLAAIFSMNTKNTPLVDRPDSFWIILSVMVVGMITLAAYFKRKGWF